MDDGTNGGSVEDVKQDLELVTREGVELGRHLNECKTEVISSFITVSDSIMSLIPGAQLTSPISASLLGSPIGDVNSICDAVADRTQLLRTMGDRLQSFSAHDALLLFLSKYY